MTGASGFIGRHAIDGLIRRGYEVHAISRFHSDSAATIYWHNVDMFNSMQVENIFKTIRPSHLLHFAWNVDPKSYMMSIENFHWVRASMDLLDSFQKNGGVRAVFAGTCAEYDWRYGCLSEKLMPCQPSSIYGICKNSLNAMMSAFCLSSGISAAWGRIFFLYGPYEAASRLVASTIKSLLQGEPALCTHGEQYRDFLYVEDVADAFCALLDSPITGSVNIASGEPIKLRKLVQLIATIIGNPEMLQIGKIESRFGEPPLLCANVERLSIEVGWKPRYNINEGIEKTIQWWQNCLELTGR
ncbi:MAG TPA: NAD(P)-dependent oxidoreductase [Negativicutes bacterium]